MVDVVEQGLDVELDDPVILPASPPDDAYCVQGGIPWTVAVRVAVKHRLEYRLKDLLDHGLRDSIRHRRHTQQSCAPALLWNGDAFDRRREVAAGAQAVPKLVQVVTELAFKRLDRFLVYTG